jgi:hypothetical protein
VLVQKRRVKLAKNIGRLLGFQLKLFADALRDFLMSPLSVMCFFLDLILASEEGNSFYSRLMRLGRKSDSWINLFEEHAEPEVAELKSPLE